MKFIRPNTITDAGGTYTRAAGTATYFNSSGVLTLGSTNVPRENYVYDKTTSQWRLDGVLIEPAATNLVLRSQEFGTSPWTFAAPYTVSANADVAPDGTNTADILVVDSGQNSYVSSVVRQTVTKAGVATTYVWSQFYRGFSFGTSVRLQPYGATTGDSVSTVVSLIDGSILSQPISLGGFSNPSVTVVTLPDSWFRISLTFTTDTATTVTLRAFPYSGNSPLTGDGTSGLIVWGAQLETVTASGTSSSYIPTTTATVTRPADTVTGTGMIYSSIAENDYSAWSAATAYVLGDRVIRTTATTHKIYERVVAGTTATAPESDPVNWIEVSPTNRWKLFDESPSTITTAATETMSYILKPGRSNSFSALEVDATEISVNVYISGERVYSGYTNMLNNENVGNWYEYFYEPFYYQTSLAITDLLNAANLELPASTDMIITVTLRKAGGTPSIGALVTGIVYELGKTQNGMNLSIIDYSRKDTNDYGNTVLVRRKFSKRLSATFFLYSSKVDVVSNLLTQYRATPVVWIGADNNYNSLVIYGFYRDWNIGIPNNIGSTCNIEIEGLA